MDENYKINIKNNPLVYNYNEKNKEMDTLEIQLIIDEGIEFLEMINMISNYN